MRCRRHDWESKGIRMLRVRITRGCQEANAEMWRQCKACGKEERTGLLNVRPQSYVAGQTSS